MIFARIFCFIIIIVSFPFGVYHGLKRSDTALFIYKSLIGLRPLSSPVKLDFSKDQIDYFSKSFRLRQFPLAGDSDKPSVPTTSPQLLSTPNSFDFRTIQITDIASPESYIDPNSLMNDYRLKYRNTHNFTRSFWFSCKKTLTDSKKLLLVLPGSGEREYMKILDGTSHYQSNYEEFFGTDYNLCVLPRPSESLRISDNALGPIHNLYQLNFVERGTTESVIHLNDLLAIVYSIDKYYPSLPISLAGISAGGRLVIAASLITDPVLDRVDFHSFSGFSLLHLFFDEPMDLNQPIIPGLYQPFISTSSDDKLNRKVNLYYGLEEDDYYGIEAKFSFTCNEASRLYSQLRCYQHYDGHVVPRQAILK